MASNKTVTLQNYNGTDYDTLYLKTNVAQVEGLDFQAIINAMPTLFVRTTAPTSGDGKNGDIWIMKV